MEISAQETEDSSPCSACDKCDGMEPESVSKPTSWLNFQISPLTLWMEVVALILKQPFTMASSVHSEPVLNTSLVYTGLQKARLIPWWFIHKAIQKVISHTSWEFSIRPNT